MKLTTLVAVPTIAIGVILLASLPLLMMNRPLSARDRDSYRSEISLLRSKAQINLDASREMQALGGYSHAKSAINDAMLYTKIAGCLEDTLVRRVPFQEAMATCKAAYSD